jgi:hypothetical protein
MIIRFKLFENMSSSYILSLDELWTSYDNNFSELYPDVKLRKRDTKSRCYYFRLDLPKILIGKEIELPIYDNNGNKNIKHGEIEDVWTRYSQGGFMAKWSYKLKINGKWHTLKNNDINISDQKQN